MKKRLSKKSPVNIPASPVSQKQDHSTALDEIHQKINNSAALNGGFDTLLYKIDKIEQGQGQLVTKVDKIHDAIYDPHDGIFSKIADHKLANTEKFNELSQNIAEINTWKLQKEKEEAKEEASLDQSITRLITLEKSVESLVKSKESTWSVLKWFFVAVGGGIITLFFTWLETKIK